MSVIEVNNISKIYNISHESGKYLVLRDKISNYSKNPLLLFPGNKNRNDKLFYALKNISFKLEEGDTLGIIGHNGAGKSTLLKLLAKVVQPSAGQIKIKGKAASLLEVGAGFHPELTGQENIMFNGILLGMKRKEIQKKYNEIVEFSGVEKFIEVPVKRYSSGMYVRLAFSVAAFLESKLLFIDEIMAVGDIEFQEKCIEKMKEEIKKNGKTIILVSHNLNYIRELCKKCIFLEQGEIQAYGPTDEVIEKYVYYKKEDAKIPIELRKERGGNGGIRIKKISIYNDQEDNPGLLRTGDDLIFLIEYRVSDKKLKFFDISIPIISFYNQTKIAQIYTKIINHPIRLGGNNDGSVKIKIKNIPLNHGKYKYNIWVESGEELLDWVLNAGSFEIDFFDYYGSNLMPLESLGQVILDYSVEE